MVEFLQNVDLFQLLKDIKRKRWRFDRHDVCRRTEAPGPRGSLNVIPTILKGGPKKVLSNSGGRGPF